MKTNKTLFVEILEKRNEIEIKSVENKLNRINSEIESYRRAIERAEDIEQLELIENEANQLKVNYISFVKNNRNAIVKAIATYIEIDSTLTQINNALNVNINAI